MPTSNVRTGSSKSAKKKAPSKAVSGNGKAKGNGKSDVEEVMTEPSTGQNRIPGMPIKVVKPLVNFAIQHEETKKAHALLTDQLGDQNIEGLTLYKKYKEHFDDDGKGGKIYEAGGVQIIIPAQKLTIKTKQIAPVDE